MVALGMLSCDDKVTVSLTDRWQIGEDAVKALDAVVMSESTLASGLHFNVLTLYSGAKIQNERLYLNGKGSSITINFLFKEDIYGRYDIIENEAIPTKDKFIAFYLKDYTLMLPDTDKKVQIQSGVMEISKTTKGTKVVFDFVDKNNNTVKGIYEGEILKTNSIQE